MRSRIGKGLATAALMTMTCIAGAQAPVIGPGSAEDAVLQKQRHASAAYRDLQQAQYEAKLAEQDFLNAQDALAQQPSAIAPQPPEERKRQLETAKKVFTAAQAKVAQARKRYDEAVSGVDQALQKPPAGDKK